MNFRERVLAAIFIVLGISLGLILSAQAQTPGPFFRKNLASCFYCTQDNSVTASVKVDLPNMKNLKADSISSDSTTSETSAAVEITGVDEKAPEPFKNFVRAYEQGDMKNAYREARRWVEYQDKILKRTTDLATLVNKARLELDSENIADAMISPESELMLIDAVEGNQNPLRVYFFFDSSSDLTNQAITEIENFYQNTITRADIEIIGIADGEMNIDDLAALKESYNFTFPVKFDLDLAQALEIRKLPALIGVSSKNPRPCRYEGNFEESELSSFINACKILGSRDLK